MDREKTGRGREREKDREKEASSEPLAPRLPFLPFHHPPQSSVPEEQPLYPRPMLRLPAQTKQNASSQGAEASQWLFP